MAAKKKTATVTTSWLHYVGDVIKRGNGDTWTVTAVKTIWKHGVPLVVIHVDVT